MSFGDLYELLQTPKNRLILLPAVPSVDLAFFRERKEVNTEVVILDQAIPQQLVKVVLVVFLVEGYVPHFNLLFDVKTPNALYHHLCYYPYGTDSSDCRLEKVIRWLAFVYVPIAVY